MPPILGRLLLSILPIPPRSADGELSRTEARARHGQVYDRYVTDRGLCAVQAETKAAGLGLWTDNEPMPPWERRSQ